MAWITNFLSGFGSSTDSEVWGAGPRDPVTGDYCVISRCRKNTSQSTSATADVTEMDIPLKFGSVYGFSYDILYSTSGVLCGAQFALTFGGTLVSIGYGITIVTIANGVVSDTTTSIGTFVGSGASVAGGGPKTARISGSIKTGGTVGGNLVLRMQPTGVAASVTIQPNSCGKAEEQ